MTLATKANSLKTAIIKSFWHNESGTWYAYATPAEITTLLKAGAVSNNNAQCTFIKKCLVEGNCRPHWFYFKPNNPLRDLLYAKIK